MATKPSIKAQAWAAFDRIVADAAPEGQHTNPWRRDPAGALVYEPDTKTLTRLLGVPLALDAATTTGAPALALDVWLAYELRRAGFDPDAVWPRATRPRVLPGPIAALLKKLPKERRQDLVERLTKGSPPQGVAAGEANILGKNYRKQVDVVMSAWDTGPELLISSKRMDSSFGKNAANRVEESYGDAKNLRSRHPLAAMGFVYGVRSTIFDAEFDKAVWLIDLLQKLGREDDAYHAVALLVLDYRDQSPLAPDDAGDGEDPLVEAGLDAREPIEDHDAVIDDDQIDEFVANLPPVELLHGLVPADLAPGRFLAEMTNRVLDATPVNVHREARLRQRLADS